MVVLVLSLDSFFSSFIISPSYMKNDCVWETTYYFIFGHLSKYISKVLLFIFVLLFELTSSALLVHQFSLYVLLITCLIPILPSSLLLMFFPHIIYDIVYYQKSHTLRIYEICVSLLFLAHLKKFLISLSILGALSLYSVFDHFNSRSACRY